MILIEIPYADGEDNTLTVSLTPEKEIDMYNEYSEGFILTFEELERIYNLAKIYCK